MTAEPEEADQPPEDDTRLDRINYGLAEAIPGEAAGRSAGQRVGDGIAWALAFVGGLLMQPVTVVVRVTPFGARFWRGLWLLSLKKYHQKAGGDAVGLEATPSGLRPVPIKWREGLDEIGEAPGWKAKGRDRVWEAAPSGDEEIRLGKTPVVPLAHDAPRAGSLFDCQVAAAVDKGRMRPLYNVEEGEFTAEIGMGTGASGQAVADGGQYHADFQPTASPLFEDMIIDIGSDEGFRGTAISFDAYSDLLQETATSEQMKLQEQRGYLAGMDPSDYKQTMLKMMLIAAAVAVAGLIGPELVTALFGGGGGGGGSVMPFHIGVGWW